MFVLKVLLLFFSVFSKKIELPLPFTRVLKYVESSKLLEGQDVFILQKLIKRSNVTQHSKQHRIGYYDKYTFLDVKNFQNAYGLPPTGEFEEKTANMLLNICSYDGYRDIVLKLSRLPSPYKYFVYIPVYQNREIETIARLYDTNLELLHQFTSRTKGQNDYNQFTSSGETPTGLYTFDLNAPENDPKSFGPYNVNRLIRGLKGNAHVLCNAENNYSHYIRKGLLMHTGEWKDWNTSLPMPNSHGCIHTHPQDCKNVSDTLLSLGVEVRKNLFSKYIPYPYQEQGLISIEEIRT